jgi:hypothetical protein
MMLRRVNAFGANIIVAPSRRGCAVRLPETRK